MRQMTLLTAQRLRMEETMARRGGGFPGGGNMQNLMKQAQKMQRQMEQAQADLEEKDFTATAGGGAVRVIVSGARQIKNIEIDKDVVDPEDVEMLQDLILAAVNEALKQVDDFSSQSMSRFTGGFGL